MTDQPQPRPFPVKDSGVKPFDPAREQNVALDASATGAPWPFPGAHTADPAPAAPHTQPTPAAVPATPGAPPAVNSPVSEPATAPLPAAVHAAPPSKTSQERLLIQRQTQKPAALGPNSTTTPPYPGYGR
jgi:hypothetical protein